MQELNQRKLKNKLIELKKQLESVNDQDPYKRADYSDENTQDDDAAEREEHIRVEAIQEDLEKRILKIEKALQKMETGKYGLCEECGGKIDKARLKLMPEAEICMECMRRK